MAERISFSEFGPRFIAELLTGKLLEAQVRGAIAARIPIDEDLGKGVVEFKGVDPIFPRAERCQVCCEASVHLTVNITTPLGPLPPVDTTLVLKLIFKAYSPLYLLAEIPALTPDDIRLEYKMHNPADWVLIEGIVKGKIVEQINTKVKESRYQRIIDFEALLLEQTAHAADNPAEPPPPAIDLNSGGDILIPRDELAKGQLRPGQSLTGSLLLSKNERLHVLIYGKSLETGVMFSHGANGEFSLKGNKQSDSSTFSVGSEAWGNDYDVGKFPDNPAGFEPAASGWYHFVLKTDKASPSKCEFVIKQKRTIGDQDLLAGRASICFDELGRNLFQIGLSQEMLRRMIAGQIQAALRANALQKPWKDSPLGSVVISLVPTLKDLAQIQSAEPEAEVLWKLGVSAKLKVMRGNEQLFLLPLEIKPTLALVATKNPTAIQVELRPLRKEDFTVDEDRIQMIDAKMEKFVKTILLHGDLAGKFEEWVTSFSEKLLNSLAVNTQVISALAEKRADAARPKAAEPRPVFEGKSFKPVAIKAGEAQYYRVTLRKKQTVIGAAGITPRHPPGVLGATVSLAVCDEMCGLLAESESHTWNPGKAGKKLLGLRFTAPDAGPYQFRVRANPGGGEAYESVLCEFEITEAK